MRLGRPVTALAPCIGRIIFAARNTLEMRILVELRPDVRMARPAHGASDIAGMPRLLAVRDGHKYREEESSGNPEGNKNAIAFPRSFLHDVYRVLL